MIKKGFILFLLIMSGNTFSKDQSSLIEDYYKLFKDGFFEASFEVLSTGEGIIDKGKLNYLRGLSMARAKEYDESSDYFEIALEQNYVPDDIFYELGQAYYAQDMLIKAQEMFTKSARRKYELGSSLYYVGYILERRLKFNHAELVYEKIQRIPRDKWKVKQLSLFNIAKMYEQRYLKFIHDPRWDKYKDNFFDSVIYKYERALRYAPRSVLGKEIRLKLNNFKLEYAPDTLHQRYWKRWSVLFYENFYHDSNVTFEAENPAEVTASNNSSYVSETGLYAKYSFFIKRRWVITPDLTYSFSHYMNDEEESVFENNSYAYSLGLKNTFKSRMFKKKTETYLYSSFGNNHKDYEQIHDRKKYSSITTFNFGQNIWFFPSVGKSNWQFSYSSNSVYNEELSGSTMSFSFNQYLLYGNSYDINLGYSYSSYTSNTPDYNTITNSFFISSTWHNIWESLYFSTDLNYSFVNNAQEDERGIEKLLNLTFTFGVPIDKYIDLSTYYNLENNSSQSQDTYAYSKHAIGMNLSFRY